MKQHSQVLLLAGLSLFLFIYGAWQLPFLGPDEPRYSQIARQMLEDGDYVVPHLGTNAWFEKPVLLYWLMSISFRIFGINEFAARFPSALAALCCVLLIYYAVRRLSDHKRGLICAGVLSTTSFFVGFAHAATFDMLLTLCVTAALMMFAVADAENWNRRFLLWMYAASAVGVLSKGFVCLIIVGLAIFSYLFISRRIREIAKLQLVPGALIFAGILCVWFVPVTFAYGFRFWDEFFVQHHLVRYTSSHFHRSQGTFFYLPVLFAGSYPWSLSPFICREPKHQKLWKFALCWLTTTVLFFSLSQSKLPGYILPAAPAFAILGGLALANLSEGRGKYLKAIFLMAATQILLLAALLWGKIKYDVPNEAIYAAAAVIIVTSIAFFLFIKKSRILASAIIAGVCFLGLMNVFLHLIYPRLGWADSKTLSNRVLPFLTQDRKIAVYNVYDFAPLFYTNARVELTPEGYLYTIRDFQQLYQYLSRVKTGFVLLGNEELHWIKEANYWKVANIISGQNMSIVELRIRAR